MPIQREIGFGERFFRGARNITPLIMQYLQNREQQDTPLDLSGVAPSQPVGLAGGVATDYDTPLVRNLLSQMGGQPQGVDPQAMLQSLSQQPEPVKPLTGEAGVLQYLRENDPEAYEGYIRKKIYIAPPKTATGKGSDLAEKVFLKRLGQTKETGEIDIKSGTITESKVPFGITEARAAADSVRSFTQPQTRPLKARPSKQASFQTLPEFMQWYNSPEGRTHSRRDELLKQAQTYFGD